MGRYDSLKLENQLCFPLYASSREIIKLYRPYLEKLNLTYTQYIAMLVCWEEGSISVKDMGIRLFLDSGTLTPVLKSLEGKGYVTRERSTLDERVVLVKLTSKGKALRERALHIPGEMAKHVCLTPEERQTLYELVYKLLKRQGE